MNLILNKISTEQNNWYFRVALSASFLGGRHFPAVPESLVPPGKRGPCEPLATHAAGVPLLPRVDQQVPREVALQPEGLSADVARVRLPSAQVELPVLGQVERMAEQLAALGTLVGPLSRVHPLVADKVELPRELLVARRTREGPVTGVCLLMSHHVVSLIGRVRAVGTLPFPWRPW